MIPTALTIAVCGGGFVALLLLIAWALCGIAKDADQALDARDDARLAEVHHLCERRTRRDTRNGLGGAA